MREYDSRNADQPPLAQIKKWIEFDTPDCKGDGDTEYWRAYRDAHRETLKKIAELTDPPETE